MENTNLSPQHYSLVTDGLAKYGCDFHDDIWTFTNPSRDSIADRPTTFNWPKILDQPYKLSPHYAGLLKSVTACMLVGLAGVRYSPETVNVKIKFIRRFLFRAYERGFPALATITAIQAQKIIEELFSNNGEKRHCNKTIGQCLFSINLIHRLSTYTGDGFESEPFPTKARKRILFGFRELEEWQAPPNNVSFYLLKQAMKLIDSCTEELLRVYGKYVEAVEKIKARGETNRTTIAKYADSAISNENFRFSPGLCKPLDSLKASRQQDVSALLCHIQTACFIVITFTTAPRISEVRRARVNSISKRKHYTGREYYYYSSARSKTRYSADLESSYDDQGGDDPWVLSSAAVKAFETLTRLSAPARMASGSDNLWLVSNGDTLWPFFPKIGFNVISSTAMNIRLNTFSKFIELSEVTGWSRRLHSHMGRKLFARFVAMRDRSALGDLAVQYSHTSAYSVDISYAKPGVEFRRLVKDELALEIEAAVRDLIGVDIGTIYTTPSGVHQSESILRFAGEIRTNKDILLLLRRGVKLIPCQWGACNYKQELSACEGSREEPNPVKRTPEVCSRCSNFLATPKHEIWWQQYRGDSLKWLSLSGIPDQTRNVLKLRLQQAEKVLSIIARG